MIPLKVLAVLLLIASMFHLMTSKDKLAILSGFGIILSIRLLIG